MLLFVDQLSNVDFSFLDPERGLVGETWLANVEMTGTLDAQGMVCDFGIVKKRTRDWLDTVIDHCLLVPSKSPCLKYKSDGKHYDLTWHAKKGDIRCRAPYEAVALIDCEVITPAAVADWCISKLLPQFPSSVKKLDLNFTTEHISGPYYHYSHGLKKHAGNCQRIAHGHRSKIEIWRNNELSHTDMGGWAEKWQDIYIGTVEDLVDTSNSPTHYEFAYQSVQGDFFLSLDKSHCYLIDTDTTVEQIAQHVATTLAEQNPGNRFKVKAFEGIGKGAIAKSHSS